MNSGNKNDAPKSAFKATIWYLICDFVTRGISFITMPIFTRMMTTGEIGSYSIMTSWISILSVVITLNLIQSVFLAKYDYKDDYQGFISTVATLGLMSAAICYVVIFPFREQIAGFLGMEVYAVDIMAIHLMFCQMSGVLLAKYRANLEYKKSVALTLGTTIIVTISAILCTLNFRDALKGRIYGTYVPTIIINILLFIFLLYHRKSFKKAYCKYALTICLPLIIHNLAGNIIHSSDRVMIGKLCSDEDAGLYGVAYTCAMFANMLRNSMNIAWNPWVFDKINENKVKEIKKASYIYLLAFFVLCIGIIVLAPEVLYILGGKPYQMAVYVVPPVVASYMFSMVYSLYAGIEQYYKKQKYFAFVATICAILNIVLNYIFIPIYGYIAAAYTTLASTALECLLHYLNVRKMGMTKIYNTKYNLGILFIMLCVSIISVALYRNAVIRYSLIGFGVLGVMVVCMIKRAKIKELVESTIRRRT